MVLCNMTEEKALIEIKEVFTINGELNERYYHTLGVIEKALELNEIHNLKIPKEQVFLSAAFHDVAKFLDKKSMLEILDKYFHNIYQSLLEYPSIWHSFVGKIVAREKYGIIDDRILNAICYHTTGRPNMTNLDKFLLLIDKQVYYFSLNTLWFARLLQQLHHLNSYLQPFLLPQSIHQREFFLQHNH